MDIPGNLLSNPVVKREIKPSSTQPAGLTVETIDGLPFYYYIGPKLAFLLIGIGIIYLIVHVLIAIGALILPYRSKKFICTNCKKIIYRERNPETCFACGGTVVPIKEYSPYEEDRDFS